MGVEMWMASPSTSLPQKKLPSSEKFPLGMHGDVAPMENLLELVSCKDFPSALYIFIEKN